VAADIGQARSFLAKERLLHIDMLESIGRGHADLICASDRGVLLYNRAGTVHMMSAADEAAAAAMLDCLPQSALFVAHSLFIWRPQKSA